MEFYIKGAHSDFFLVPTQEEVDKAIAAPWGGYDAAADRKDRVKIFAQDKPLANEEQCAAWLWHDRCEQEAKISERRWDNFRTSKYPIKHWMGLDGAQLALKWDKEILKGALDRCLQCGAMQRCADPGCSHIISFSVYLVAEICPPIYAAASPFLRPFPYELLK